MVYTLPYHCLKLCSDWTKFDEELSFFERSIFKKRVSFVIYCFKTFVDTLFIKRPQLITVEKKNLLLPLPYIGEISLKTRTKLRKSLRGLLNSCKL